jgi:hypothetical protein
MTLIELIRHLDDMARTDNPSIVYGMRINGVWSEHSPVTVHPYIVGETAELMDDTGLEYMLELELIDEVVTVAELWFPNLVPLSDRHKVDAVIYYIEHDAYIPRLGDHAI